MNGTLYSLRMRATCAGRHLSGAERIVPAERVAETAGQLVERALQSSDPEPDDIRCRIDAIDPASLSYRALPALSTWHVPDWSAGRDAAFELLTRAGVSAAAASEVLRLLANGPAPGGRVMRGAMLIDADTGERLEPDRKRGVRVSRMDMATDIEPELVAALEACGLGHHRVREALVLAGKTIAAPGMIAELCWSDDPAYVTGYVADPVHGYQRISTLKLPGDPHGGRAFFIDQGVDLEILIDYLERQPVLFNELGSIHQPVAWEERQ